MAVGVLAAMAVALLYLGLDRQVAVTVAFTTLAFAQMWHVFNMRGRHSEFWRNEVTQNRWIWAALGICLVLVLGAIFTPTLSAVLKLTNPGRAGWLVILVASLLPLLAAPFVRSAARRLALYRRG